MVDRLGMHGLHHADIIHHLRHMRQQVTDPGAGLAVATELPGRLHQGEALLARGHAGQALTIANLRRQLRHVELLERGLVVEQVNL